MSYIKKKFNNTRLNNNYFLLDNKLILNLVSPILCPNIHDVTPLSHKLLRNAQIQSTFESNLKINFIDYEKHVIIIMRFKVNVVIILDV